MNQKFTILKRLYSKVFRAETSYIPLIVTPPCPELPSVDEFWLDNTKAVKKYIKAIVPKIAVGSDWLPTVEIGTYQGIVVPSLFGADFLKVNGSDPMAHRCFDSLAEALDAGIPDINSDIFDRMICDLRGALAVLPEDVYLAFAPTASPFDLAQLMIGEDFLLNLIECPEKAMQFLQDLSDLCIQIINIVKDELGQSKNETVTNRGVIFPGYRLPSDAIVNYSPQIIRKFVNPILGRFKQEYGSLCIHYCTQPAPSGHVLPAFLDSNHVLAVDNWQGIDDFIGEKIPRNLQEQITILSDVEFNTNESIDTFLSHPAIKNVPRIGGRALVLTTTAESVEQGKSIYKQWQQRMESCLN